MDDRSKAYTLAYLTLAVDRKKPPRYSFLKYGHMSDKIQVSCHNPGKSGIELVLSKT